MNHALERVSDAALKALDLNLMRHQVAAQNIARANEPGFLAHRVSISDRAGSAESQPGTHPVRLDHEVAEMVSASLEYQLIADALSRYLGMSRLAISTRS